MAGNQDSLPDKEIENMPVNELDSEVKNDFFLKESQMPYKEIHSTAYMYHKNN